MLPRKHLLVPGEPGKGLWTQLRVELDYPDNMDLHEYFTHTRVFDKLHFCKDADILMSANHLTDIDSFEDIIKLCLDGKEVSIYERPHTFLYTGRIVLYINFPIEEVHPALRDRFSIVQPQDVKTFLAIEGILTQD